MAREPSTSASTDAPKVKRKSGPRVAKDKVVFALFKGSIESMDIVHNAEEALDRKEADGSLTVKKIVIPAKKSTRNQPASAQPTA